MVNETKWSLDQTHTEIAFKVSHLMIAHVKGKFKTFDASIYTKGKDFKTAEIHVWIDASSITTGDVKRDEFLKGPEFLDAQNHKQIAFTSNTIRKTNSVNDYEIWGELTIRGITKRLRLSVQSKGVSNDLSANEKAEFTVTGNIRRSDWGLDSKASEIGLMIGDEIELACEIELINEGQKEQTMELEKGYSKETV
jgi:polyisoprenoid-binding protein YceI